MRVLRGSHLLTSILLGVVSLLIAFSAYLASQYSDRASERDSLANRMSTDAIRQGQEDYAEHATDTAIWLQVVAAGGRWEDDPRAALLSSRWTDSVRRTEARGFDVLAVVPTDDLYFAQLQVRAEAYAQQVATTYEEARQAGVVSARLTGASVIYSAALLLLTIASTTERRGVRVALNVVAAVIIVIAVALGLGTLAWQDATAGTQSAR